MAEAKKRDKIIAFLALILLTTIVLHPATAQAPEEQKANESIASLTDTTNKVIDKADTVVDKEVMLPSFLAKIMNVLWRFESPITVSQLIVGLALTLLFALIFIDIFQLFSPFSHLTAVGIGIVLTVILAALGTIKSITNILIDKGNFFGLIEKSSAGALLFWVILIGAAIFIIRYWKNYLSQRKLLQQARAQGIQSASVLQLGKAFMNTMSRVFRSP